MNTAELHSKYMRETNKHPINENSKEGAYSDEYVNWLQSIVVNNNDLHLVSEIKSIKDEVIKNYDKHKNNNDINAADKCRYMAIGYDQSIKIIEKYSR